MHLRNEWYEAPVSTGSATAVETGAINRIRKSARKLRSEWQGSIVDFVADQIFAAGRRETLINGCKLVESI